MQNSMNKNDDLISVIVPVYNIEKYVERCIDSIINQTYSNLEIIIVDDGSTDMSGTIVDNIQRKDSRIKVIHKENGGLSSARNTGLDNSSGKYIGFIDGDDMISTDTYMTLYNEMVSTDSDIATCGMKEYQISGDMNTRFCHFPDNMILENEKILEAYIKEPYIIGTSCCTKLFKKEIVKGELFEIGNQAEDIEYVFRILLKAKRVICIPQPYYEYVHRENSLTTDESISEHIFDEVKVVNHIYETVATLYKRLEKYANEYRIKSMLMVYQKVKKNGDYVKYKQDMKKIQKVLRKNRFKILFFSDLWWYYKYLMFWV